MKKYLLASTLIAATAVAVPAFADTLTWGGSDGSWTDSGVWNGSTWTDNDDAIFGSGESTVTVTGTVTANSVTIDSGASYTFAIDESATLTTGTLSNSGSLALTGSGKIVTSTGNSGTTALVVDASNFSGTIEIGATSWLDGVNSKISSDTKIVLDTSGGTSELYSDATSIYFGNASSGTEVEFVADIELSGTGGAMIRTGGAIVTISGDVTGDEGAELQKNGAGSLTFTGSVNISEYINYQDNTTFAGTSTTIGTLEFSNDGGGTNASSVTFSTDASVGAITVGTTSTAFTDQLTVDSGATLTVGSISLGVDTLEVTASEGTMIVTGNITVDGGKLSIGEGSTVTATGATSSGGASYSGISGAGTFVYAGTDSDNQNNTFAFSGSDFTGTLEIKNGTLDLSQVTLSDSTKVVIDGAGSLNTSDYFELSAANAILFGSSNTTIANNIEITGEGGVIIRAGGVSDTATISGTVTGSAGTYLQLNGSKAVTFTNTVTLAGTYINFQGTTTFQGTTSIGTLEINENVDTTSAVIFSGSNAQATVGTLNVESNGTGTDTLTVENGAKLTITQALAINHDFAITLDAGTLDIQATSVTQDSSKSTSITISNGGTLSVGDSVTLNNATINIVLGEENISNSVDPTSAAVTFAYGDGVYALTGSGTIDGATITITVSEALAELLAAGGEYTINVYEEGLTLGEGVTWDTTALEQYGITWDGGTINIGPLPEPELFSVFLGISALGLMATRRRRRRVA